MGDFTATAVSAGRITGPSPATHVPIGAPFADVSVAVVTSGSPGSKSQPAIQAAAIRTLALEADSGIASAAEFRLKAETTGSRAKEPEEPDEPGEPEEPGEPGAPVPRGCPPSTHAAMTAISAGVSDG